MTRANSRPCWLRHRGRAGVVAAAAGRSSSGVFYGGPVATRTQSFACLLSRYISSTYHTRHRETGRIRRGWRDCRQLRSCPRHYEVQWTSFSHLLYRRSSQKRRPLCWLLELPRAFSCRNAFRRCLVRLRDPFQKPRRSEGDALYRLLLHARATYRREGVAQRVGCCLRPQADTTAWPCRGCHWRPRRFLPHDGVVPSRSLGTRFFHCQRADCLGRQDTGFDTQALNPSWP